MRIFSLAIFTAACVVFLSISGCVTPREKPVAVSNILQSEKTMDSKEQELLQRAIEHLRDDDEKWNCHAAMYYLYERREKVWQYMFENLDIDDLQAKDALIRILCETKSFEPDENFIRLVMDRIDKHDGFDSLEAHHSMYHDFISYLAVQAPKFHVTIAAGIKTKNTFLLYGVTYALYKSGTLRYHLDEYTPEVVSNIVSGLRGEDLRYNIKSGNRRTYYFSGERCHYINTENVRICMMLGEKCLPALQKRTPNDTLAVLIVKAIRDNNREARDTIHLEYSTLYSSFLECNSRYPDGILPLAEILYNVRPSLFVDRGK